VFQKWKKRSIDKSVGTTTPMSQNSHLVPDGSPLILRLSMIVGFLTVLLLVVVTKRP
jgi:hypothetical protein